METDLVIKPRDVMPPGATTLPAPFYTDDAYFRREMELLYARMWVSVGRTEQIEKPGQFIVRELLGRASSSPPTAPEK